MLLSKTTLLPITTRAFAMPAGRFLALVASLALVAGCSPDLGDAPFRCNGGTPRCPDGYTCNAADICVRSGSCPEGLPGCSTCGNGVCDPAESCSSCALDCGACASCGDDRCDAATGESCKNCPGDCGACAPPSCGNGKCDVSETTQSCPADCKPNPCGNGKCDVGETSLSCPADCEPASKPCGNGKCDAGETSLSCPADCKPASKPCGNGKCDTGETSLSCPADCKPSPCGNGICDATESYASCPQDCTCGNGTCDAGETTTSCGVDCSPTKPVYGELCQHSGVSCEFPLWCVSSVVQPAGVCTMECSAPKAACSGVPAGHAAICADKAINGRYFCDFICDGQTPCPKGMICPDPVSGGRCKLP